MKMADLSNYMLGHYVRIAVNDPKHYPKEPLGIKSETQDQPSNQMDEFDEAKINAMMAAFASKTSKLPSAEPEPPQQGNTQATAHNKKQRS